MPMDSPGPRPRNRDETRAAILRAAQDLLADEGFSGFGINALARRSGHDKQLIYRYFGGLEGLIDAIGDALATWIAQRLEPAMIQPPGPAYADLIETVLIAYLDALRSDSLMQRIVAWEVSDPSPHVRRLADQRALGLAALVTRLRGDRAATLGTDAPALNAVLIAAAQHLVLASSTANQFAGLPLRSDADWDRVKQTLRRLIRACY